MKLTDDLYRKLARKAMRASQISMESPKNGDEAWREYKYAVYRLLAKGYDVPTDDTHSPANPNNWSCF